MSALPKFGGSQEGEPAEQLTSRKQLQSLWFSEYASSADLAPAVSSLHGFFSAATALYKSVVKDAIVPENLREMMLAMTQQHNKAWWTASRVEAFGKMTASSYDWP